MGPFHFATAQVPFLSFHCLIAFFLILLLQIWQHIQDPHIGVSLCDDLEPWGSEIRYGHSSSSVQTHLSGEQRANAGSTGSLLSARRVPLQIEEARHEGSHAGDAQGPSFRCWNDRSKFSCVVGRAGNQHFSRDEDGKLIFIFIWLPLYLFLRRSTLTDSVSL